MNNSDLDIFTPIYYSGLRKKRIGSKNDGGYVISTDIDNYYDLILSGGAGNNISFEKELSELFKANCIIYDHTVNVQTKNTSIFHIKQRLDEKTETFYKYIDIHQNLFLKLDIEGGEYKILSHLTQDQIKKFKQIVIEFHDCYNDIKIKLLKKLFVNHKLVHLHPNNCCGTIDFHGVKVPKIVELTFVRNSEIKNSFEIKNNTQSIPTEIDYPNLKNRPDIQLNYYPFVAKD